MLTPRPCWPRRKLVWKSKKKWVWLGDRAQKQADSSREVPDMSLRVRCSWKKLSETGQKSADWPLWPPGANSEFTNRKSSRVRSRTEKISGSYTKNQLGFRFSLLNEIIAEQKREEEGKDVLEPETKTLCYMKVSYSICSTSSSSAKEQKSGTQTRCVTGDQIFTAKILKKSFFPHTNTVWCMFVPVQLVT